MKKLKEFDDDDIVLSGKKALKYLPIPFAVLSALGFWLPDPIRQSRTLYYKAQLFVIFLVWTNSILEAISFILDFVTRKFNIYDFGLYSVTLVCAAKGVIIIRKGRSIVEIILIAFSQKWTVARDPEEQVITNRNSSECRIIHKAFIYVNSVSVWMYVIGPIALYLRGNPTLPGRVWYPYDSYSNPYLFWLSYVQISILLLYDGYMQFATELIFVGLLIQVRNQLQLLSHRVKEFTRNESFIKQQKLSTYKNGKLEIDLLKEFIRDQRDINRLAVLINDFSVGFLTLDVINAAPNICVNLYVATTSKSTYEIAWIMMIEIYILFLLAIQCWYCNECHVQSVETAKAFYEMDWAKLDIRTRKHILTIITAAKPINFTLAKILPLNVTSFLKILKSSYSVYNVLRRRKL